jgi:hypothetical protein
MTLKEKYNSSKLKSVLNKNNIRFIKSASKIRWYGERWSSSGSVVVVVVVVVV